MIVYNNLSAIKSLNQLNKNAKGDKRASDQLSTGEKFNSSGTGKASEYSISEKMRIKIRGLDQCVDNVKKGGDMSGTALDAIDQQISIMKKVRELTLKASDGIYTDQDRKILQAEVNQMLDEVEELAQTTNFNGIPLLNGNTMTSAISHFDPLAGDIKNPGNVPFIPEAVADPDMVYNLTPEWYTDTFATDVYVSGGSALTAVPRVGDFIFQGTTPLTVVDGTAHGQPAGSVGYLDATNNFQPITAVNYNTFSSPTHPATLAPGDTVYNRTGSLLNIVQNPVTSNTAIASGSGYTYEMDLSNLFSGAISIPQGLDNTGFAIKCLDCQQHISIRFVADSDVSSTEGGTGSGASSTYLYNIGVKNVRTLNDLQAVIFNGLTNARSTPPIITSITPPSANNIVQLAPGHNTSISYNATTNKLFMTKDSNRTQLFNGVVGKVITDYRYKPHQDLALQTETTSSQYTNMRLHNTTLDALFPNGAEWDIAPRASDFPQPWPEEYDWNHQEKRPMTEDEKRQKWTEEEWPYPAKYVNLETSKCVSTQQKAAAFIDDVDQALKYLLGSATDIGAQTSRLEYTEQNLITAAENTTASESTIRDANMAAAMTEKTKQNVLSQAAQSMLAQANQTPQNIISLLQ